MDIGSATSVAGYTPSTALAQRPPVDTDGDHDNEATESAAAQQREAAKAASVPTDPNRGQFLNISV